MRQFGPKTKDHGSIGNPCPLCGVAFIQGDFTTLIALLPADIDEAERMLDGQPYTAEAEEVHVHCAEDAGYYIEK